MTQIMYTNHEMIIAKEEMARLRTENEALKVELKKARLAHDEINHEKHLKIMELLNESQQLKVKLGVAVSALNSASRLIIELGGKFPDYEDKFNGTWASYRDEFNEALQTIQGEEP